MQRLVKADFKKFVKLLALLLSTVVGFRPDTVVEPKTRFYFEAGRERDFSSDRLLMMLSAP
jgi:hypothetical protein